MWALCCLAQHFMFMACTNIFIDSMSHLNHIKSSSFVTQSNPLSTSWVGCINMDFLGHWKTAQTFVVPPLRPTFLQPLSSSVDKQVPPTSCSAVTLWTYGLWRVCPPVLSLSISRHSALSPYERTILQDKCSASPASCSLWVRQPSLSCWLPLIDSGPPPASYLTATWISSLL